MNPVVVNVPVAPRQQDIDRLRACGQRVRVYGPTTIDYDWSEHEETPDLMASFRDALHSEHRPATVEEFLSWLESEDFGDDPTRIRREAWGQ